MSEYLCSVIGCDGLETLHIGQFYDCRLGVCGDHEDIWQDDHGVLVNKYAITLGSRPYDITFDPMTLEINMEPVLS